MRLLYVCGTYAPGAFAGSELSAHELLVELSRDPAIEVLVATDQKYTGGKPGTAVWQGIRMQGLDHAERDTAIPEVIEQFKPDAMLTQLLWSDSAVQAGNARGIPTILRIPSAAPNLDIHSPTALMANSRYICEWVRETSGRKCHFIYSVIDLQRVIAVQREPRFITMFNPIREKGGLVFREIASALPERAFAVVPGWHSLRNPDGSWSREVIRNSMASTGATSFDWMPEDVDFSGQDNVTVIAPTPQVADIYARTRILLVPSQYQDTLARVSIEAMANGIPVIASKIGGVQDHVSKAGIVVGDFARPAAWVKAIRELDDEMTYQTYAERSLAYITQDFSNQETTRQFRALLKEIKAL